MNTSDQTVRLGLKATLLPDGTPIVKAQQGDVEVMFLTEDARFLGLQYVVCAALADLMSVAYKFFMERGLTQPEAIQMITEFARATRLHSGAIQSTDSAQEDSNVIRHPHFNGLSSLTQTPINEGAD